MMLRKMLVSLAVVLAVVAGGTMGILADDVGVTDTTQGVVSSETATDSGVTSSVTSESETSLGSTTEGETNSESATTLQNENTTHSGATSEITTNSESTTQSETTSKGETTSKATTTPNSETTLSEVISDGENSGDIQLKIDKNFNLSENDYFEIVETEFGKYYRVKKQGYYDLVYKGGFYSDEPSQKGFYSLSAIDVVEPVGVKEQAIKWNFYAAGADSELYPVLETNHWVFFSEDGVTISKVIEVDTKEAYDALINQKVEADVSFTYSLNPKDKGVELAMNCVAEGDTYLTRIAYWEWNSKKNIYINRGSLYSFKADSTQDTVTHLFTKNGKYKVRLEGYGGYYSEVEITVTECDDGVIFSDDDIGDVTAPKITANIDSAKNLKVGTDSCKIVIKSDEPIYLFINDVYKAELVTEYEFYANKNGEYLVRGSDESGNESEIKVVVNAFASTKLDMEQFKVTPLSELERTWGEDGVGKVYLPDELSIDYSDSSNVGTGADSQSPQTGVFNYLWLLVIAAVCGLIATFFVIRYNKKRSEDTETSSVIE